MLNNKIKGVCHFFTNGLIKIVRFSNKTRNGGFQIKNWQPLWPGG